MTPLMFFACIYLPVYCNTKTHSKLLSALYGSKPNPEVFSDLSTYWSAGKCQRSIVPLPPDEQHVWQHPPTTQTYRQNSCSQEVRCHYVLHHCSVGAFSCPVPRLNLKSTNHAIRIIWNIKIGRNCYQKPFGWIQVISSNLYLLKCTETKVVFSLE